MLLKFVLKALMMRFPASWLRNSDVAIA